MPDPRRTLRRPATGRPLMRAITHLVVVGLVAFSAAFGIAATNSGSSAARSPGSAAISLELVSRALGADAAPWISKSTAFELVPDPSRPDPLPRDVVVVVPTPEPTPLPTPVAPPPAAPEPKPVVAARPVIIQGNGQLAWPVPGGTITQYYSASHLALDIAAHAGSTVVAADKGVVTWVGWRNNGGGLVVSIDHGNGITTVYNHLGSAWVSVGQSVARGEGIAAVGCTGNCTGPHVHFEVIVGGVIVNPLRYL